MVPLTIATSVCELSIKESINLSIQCHNIADILLRLALNTNQSIKGTIKDSGYGERYFTGNKLVSVK
jgi:hypothetical protein